MALHGSHHNTGVVWGVVAPRRRALISVSVVTIVVILVLTWSRDMNFGYYKIIGGSDSSGGGGSYTPSPSPSPTPELDARPSRYGGLQYGWNSNTPSLLVDESLLTSRSAKGPYQPRPNTDFPPAGFPGIEFDSCVSYNGWPFSYEDYDAYIDDKLCLGGMETDEAVERQFSVSPGAIIAVEDSGYRTRTDVFDTFLSVSRIVHPKNASTRVMMDCSGTGSSNISRFVSCQSDYDPGLFPADGDWTGTSCTDIDAVRLGYTVFENVIFGPYDGNTFPAFLFGGSDLELPSPENRVSVLVNNHPFAVEAGRVVWSHPGPTIRGMLVPPYWREGRITVQRLPLDVSVIDEPVAEGSRMCARVVERAVIVQESFQPGRGAWHVMHNTIYRIFAAAYAAGWLQCEEGKVCIVRDHFVIASEPDILESEEIFFQNVAADDSSPSLRITKFGGLHNVCVKKAIAGAPTALETHFTASEKMGEVYHQFSLFWVNYAAPEALPTMINPPVRTSPKMFDLYRPPGSRGTFGPNAPRLLTEWAGERNISYTGYTIYPSNLADALIEMQSSTIIFGSTGAAFANLMHIRPGTVVVMAIAFFDGLWGESFYFRNMALSRGACFIRWVLDGPHPLSSDKMKFANCPPKVENYEPYLNHDAFMEVLNLALSLGVHREMNLASGGIIEPPMSATARCNTKLIVDCPLG